jgi:hypothetical protein
MKKLLVVAGSMAFLWVWFERMYKGAVEGGLRRQGRTQ